MFPLGFAYHNRRRLSGRGFVLRRICLRRICFSQDLFSPVSRRRASFRRRPAGLLRSAARGQNGWGRYGFSRAATSSAAKLEGSTTANEILEMLRLGAPMMATLFGGLQPRLRRPERARCLDAWLTGNLVGDRESSSCVHILGERVYLRTLGGTPSSVPGAVKKPGARGSRGSEPPDRCTAGIISRSSFAVDQVCNGFAW